MEGTRAVAALVLLSDRVSGADISAFLGRHGDREGVAGEPVRPGGKGRYKSAGWSVNSRLDRGASANDHIEDPLAIVTPLSGTITALVADGTLASSRVWLHLDTPDRGFYLDPTTLPAIAALGSFEVDIYS